MPGLYPLALRLAGRRVMVIGGGAVAARRIPALISAGARVVVVDPSPSAAVVELAGRVELVRRGYAPGDLPGAWLVHACTSDPAVQVTVAADAEAAGIWCVRADAGAETAALTPASGVAAGVTVAVTSGDPRRSVELRDAVLDQLRDGSLSAPRRRGQPDGGARDRGRVVLVGGGPGDPDLITVRGMKALREADVVVADRLGPRSLLSELPAGVEVIDAGKSPRGPAARQEDIIALLIERARAGDLVVRLKGGDPFIFGRGGEELLGCAKAGVECSVVPGISSSIAVPALAGIPLTHRGLAQEFVVASGHLPPGHPGSTVDWTRLGAGSATVVLMMAVQTLPAIAEALLAAGRDPSTPVACVQEGGMPEQRVLVSGLAAVANAAAAFGLAAPAVIVIGEVVGMIDQLAAAAKQVATHDLTGREPNAHEASGREPKD
jgi:uroporphyrin-III C-methyltransferase/precorrin-2 dehydrogenase/sirohydrochlorin ferrochelatase